ncbi:MAG: hypothetical protein LBV27_02935, partial [Oscillospiraceae bacterium]|nr:hypothetical protein [Oscillospiraceae bacterium]
MNEDLIVWAVLSGKALHSAFLALLKEFTILLFKAFQQGEACRSCRDGYIAYTTLRWFYFGPFAKAGYVADAATKQGAAVRRGLSLMPRRAVPLSRHKGTKRRKGGSPPPPNPRMIVPCTR